MVLRVPVAVKLYPFGVGSLTLFCKNIEQYLFEFEEVECSEEAMCAGH